jgi:hypothetical protein
MLTVLLLLEMSLNTRVPVVGVVWKERFALGDFLASPLRNAP